MPRYFFHMIDGTRDEDNRGITLADDRAAFREGVRFTGLAMASEPELLTQHLRLAVEVTNDRGQIVFVIDTVADLRERPTPPA